ncbi:MAG: CHAT domain-containing protein [Ignavibacterium sp.]|nr:CHAT domain-containing protein [Ignavibacterium sp.]
MKKSLIIFFAVMFFAIAGLFVIGTGFIPANNLSFEQNINKNPASKITPSSLFNRIEFALYNAQNISTVSDSINQLNDQFEKNYLFALADKRKSDYHNSFNRLYNLLPNYPEYYPFYDELIFSAKASNNLNLITSFISKNKSTNEYSDYLNALVAYHSNKYSEAIDILKNKNEFEPLYLLSYSYRGMGDYEKALIVLKKSELLLKNEDKSRVFVSEGSLYFLSNQYDEAEKFYIKGIESAKFWENKREEIKSLINLAILNDHDGLVDEAKQKLESALQISRSIENQELEATTLSELAVSYTYSGNVVEAKNNYEESYKIFKVLNHKERLSNLCANIASLYLQTANYSSALEYYNAGLNYAGENMVSKILNLRGLGDVYSNLSNYSKSLNYYEEAKKLSTEIKDISLQTSVDISIGTLYYNINKPIKALQVFTSAEKNIDPESDPYSAEDLFYKIGLAYAAVDSLDTSNLFFNKGLNSAKSVKDIYYQALISTEQSHNLYLQKDFNKAETLLLKLLADSKTNGFNQLYGLQNLYLAKIYLDLNQTLKARELFQTASAVAEQERDYNNLIESEYYLAKTFRVQNELTKAEEHYLKAVALADKISDELINNSEIQISHFSGLKSCYDDLAELYLEQNRNEDAFLIIEKSHSRNTLQNLVDLRINSFYKNKETLNKYYDLKWMLNSGLFSGNKLKEIISDYENIKQSIYEANPELKTIFEENTELSIEEIKNKLDKKENLVTLFFGNDNLYSIVITKDGLKVKNLSVAKSEALALLSKIAPLYSSNYQAGDLYLNQDLFSFNTKESNIFYKRIIEPILIDIPKDESLIFSMPAELAFLPVEFLVTEFRDSDSPFYYDNKKFLIENYSISYSPSASIYILQKTTKHKTEDKVLLVGDPQISNKDFSLSYRGGLLEDDSFNARNIVLFPLKYSKEEIQNLNNLFANGFVLLSGDATEKKFKENASQSSIIHLSTHSFLHKNQPLIIFSQNNDEKEDGYLETGEILQLNLNSDLVVLSSCRSGLGTVDDAEGVLGMQKSFFEAGAKSVVVSLWDVNDKYTSLFMQSFYKYLSEGFNKSESLRKAKLFFIKNYSANPYYWSAFVLSGDVSKINNIKSAQSSYLLFYILAGIIVSMLAIYFSNKKNKIIA